MSVNRAASRFNRRPRGCWINRLHVQERLRGLSFCLWSALIQKRYDVVPQSKFHIRFGLLEASRLNRDRRVLSHPVPAVVSQPELAFDAHTGRHPERYSVVCHCPSESKSYDNVIKTSSDSDAQRALCTFWKFWPQKNRGVLRPG